LKLSENKLKRFKNIIKEASEQSGRNVIPEINFLQDLDLKNIF
jgi:RsmE family RNA methyltransferase